MNEQNLTAVDSHLIPSWQDAIDDATRKIWSHELANTPDITSAELSVAIVKITRNALDSMSEDPTMWQQAEGLKVNHTGYIRFLIQQHRIEWDDPIIAESVMIIVQRAVADESLKRQ